MSYWNDPMGASLDRWITGNYGEDQYKPGIRTTLDEIQCDVCGGTIAAGAECFMEDDDCFCMDCYEQEPDIGDLADIAYDRWKEREL